MDPALHAARAPTAHHRLTSIDRPWSQCVHRPPATAIHRRRAIGPGRPAHRPRCGHRGRGGAPAGRLLSLGPRRHLRRHPPAVRASRAGGPGHGVGGPGARRGARAGRRLVLPHEPHQPDADRGQCRVLRPHRGAQGGAAEPDRRGGPHRRHRLRRLRRPRRVHRPRRAGAVRGQPEAGGQRLRAAQQPAALGVRPARLPAPASGRDQRHPHRVRGPGHADHRPPEVGPHHPRRATQHRQDQPRAQLRRACRAAGRQDGRRVQPRDEQGAARAATAQLGRQHRLPAAADRVPGGDGLHPAGARHELARRGVHLHRRHAQHQHHGAAHQGASAPGGVGARPDRSWTTSS